MECYKKERIYSQRENMAETTSENVIIHLEEESRYENPKLWSSNIEGKTWADIMEEEEQNSRERDACYPLKYNTKCNSDISKSEVSRRVISFRSGKKLITIFEDDIVMSPKEAFSIQCEKKIDLLGKTLLSRESKDLQLRGYKFKDVLTPQQNYQLPEYVKNRKYKLLTIPNRYRDKLLFVFVV